MTSSRRVALAAAALLLAGSIGGALALRPFGSPGAELDPPAIEAALTDALREIYAAFAETEEARIYDRLEAVVTADLASELYLERRTAQIADHSEGSETTVLDVEPFRIEARALPRGDGYRIHAAWRVVGRVRHGEHAHERINLYAADLILAPVGGRWKLTSFALEDVDRANDLVFQGGE